MSSLPVRVSCGIQTIFQSSGAIDDSGESVGEDPKEAADSGQQKNRRDRQLNDVTDCYDLGFSLHLVMLVRVVAMDHSLASSARD